MMVVGGLGRTWGPILGAALVMLADEGMKDFVEIRNMGYGALIVAIVVLLPQGAAGGWSRSGNGAGGSCADCGAHPAAVSRPRRHGTTRIGPGRATHAACRPLPEAPRTADPAGTPAWTGTGNPPTTLLRLHP